MNYANDYEEGYAYRVKNAGNRYYQYDLNGNVTAEQDEAFDEDTKALSKGEIKQEREDVYSQATAWGVCLLLIRQVVINRQGQGIAEAIAGTKIIC